MTGYQRGLVAGAIDTLLWGSTVLYWPHLKPSSDGEILAQRLVWASVLMMILLALTGRLGVFRRLLADGARRCCSRAQPCRSRSTGLASSGA